MNENRGSGVAGRSSFPSMIILGFSLIGIGSVLGLLFHRMGSAELFFSGLALLLFRDLYRNKASPSFRTYSRVFFVALVSFALAFSILLPLAAFEFILQGPPSSLQRVSSIIGILGAACLLVGVGPYLVWLLKGAGKQK